jgi:thiol-disulfide isomerase/thioredoxin
MLDNSDMKILALTGALILFLTSCIVQFNKDDKIVLSEKEKNLIISEWSDVDSLPPFRKAEINPTQIKNILKTKKLTLIYIFSGSCAPCLKKLPDIISNAKKNSHLYYTIVINDSYSIKRLQKIYTANDYQKPFFILSSSHYGDKLFDKISKFITDLNKNIDPKYISPGVILVNDKFDFLYYDYRIDKLDSINNTLQKVN